MAKDDYFVLAYRILSYLYACFKAGERPDMDCISADVLHIPVGYWFNIMRSLTEEGYIVGLVFPASIGSAVSVKVIDRNYSAVFTKRQGRLNCDRYYSKGL